MYYVLNENVYLVKGACRGCIYDFEQSKLYSANKALAEKLELINNTKIDENCITDEIKEVFDKFVELGVLKLSATHRRTCIEEKKKHSSQIDMAWIEITSKCNLKCRHCYNESTALCEKTMSFKDYVAVVDNLQILGVSRVQIIGGEPFFNQENLKQMLDYTIGKFDYLEIFTNGTLIKPVWYDYFAKNDIHIALSVYSYDAKEHDKVTGVDGSWEKTNATIQKLKSHGIKYRVCNVLMRDVSLGEKNTNLYELSTKKDIVRLSGRANFSLLSDELIRKKLITKKTFQSPINEAFVRRLVSGHNCFKNKIYVAADLEVYPCVMERRIKHCSIKDYGGIRINQDICNFSKDKVNVCNQCEYRYACFDCRPNSISKNPTEKPWYCTYNPIDGIWEDEEVFINRLKQIEEN